MCRSMPNLSKHQGAFFARTVGHTTTTSNLRVIEHFTGDGIGTARGSFSSQGSRNFTGSSYLTRKLTAVLQTQATMFVTHPL